MREPRADLPIALAVERPRGEHRADRGDDLAIAHRRLGSTLRPQEGRGRRGVSTTAHMRLSSSVCAAHRLHCRTSMGLLEAKMKILTLVTVAIIAVTASIAMAFDDPDNFRGVPWGASE